MQRKMKTTKPVCAGNTPSDKSASNIKSYNIDISIAQSHNHYDKFKFNLREKFQQLPLNYNIKKYSEIKLNLNVIKFAIMQNINNIFFQHMNPQSKIQFL